MSFTTNTYKTIDDVTIFYYKWHSNKNIPTKGVIQISHGVGEHAGRYQPIAKILQNEGYEVYANDHRVHGKSAKNDAFLGFYDGVAGPGTGAFWTASSSALYKINILLSSGLDRSTNFVSNICSLFTFIYLGYVNLLLGISMGFFIMIGAWLGAKSAIKFGNKFIKPVFISVVLLMSINLAFNAWY